MGLLVICENKSKIKFAKNGFRYAGHNKDTAATSNVPKSRMQSSQKSATASDFSSLENSTPSFYTIKSSLVPGWITQCPISLILRRNAMTSSPLYTFQITNKSSQDSGKTSNRTQLEEIVALLRSIF